MPQITKEQVKELEKKYIENINGALSEIYKDDLFFQNQWKEHKKDTEMMNYIKGKANSYVAGVCAMVDDKTVYSWAREYYVDFDTRAELKKQEETKKIKDSASDLLEEIKNLSRYYDKAEIKNVEVVDIENKLSAGIGDVKKLKEQLTEMKTKIETVLKKEQEEKKTKEDAF